MSHARGDETPVKAAACVPPELARPSARVVLVNWKNAPLTLRAARSIAVQLAPGDRLVLVDNGSADGSLAAMRAEVPGLLTLVGTRSPRGGAAQHGQIEVVDARENGGFGAGVMAGAQAMTEDALVLLNNDATARDGFLDALLAPLSDPDVGATTALLLLAGRYRPALAGDDEALVGPDGQRWVRLSEAEADTGEGIILVNSTGNVVDASGNGQDRDWLTPASHLSASPDVFGVCGGACAIRRDAWEAVGGIRTDLFMYYEDTDLSYKLREAGYRVRFASRAIADHEHAASSDAHSPMFMRVNARNRLIVAAEHAPWGVLARALVRSLGRAASAGFSGPAARGIAQGLAALPGALRRRSAAHASCASENAHSSKARRGRERE